MSHQPTFHDTPVRPRRQPSLHGTRQHQEHYDPYTYEATPSPGQVVPHVPYGRGATPQHQQPSPYGHQNSDSAHYNTAIDVGSPAMRREDSGVLRHRTEPSLSAGYGQSGQERQLYQGGRVSPGYEDIYDQYAGGGGAPYMTAEDDKSLYSKTSHVYERDGMYYNNVATESPSRPRHEAIEMSPYRPGGAFGAPPPMGGYGTPQPAPGSPWAGALGPPGAYLATSTPGMGRATRDGPGGYRQTRERLMRKRTVKHVELTNGNLVIDTPVPSTIAKGLSGEEHTQLRYTAVTCDPDEYIAKKYALRQFLYGRQTELFICATMYNEDEVLFCRTIGACIKNIAHLQGRSRSKTWGDGAWKKVVVCIVSDGRKKCDERTLKVLGLMGLYQEGVMKDEVLGKDTQAHVFEYTSSVVVDAKGSVQVGSCPVQFIFCLKEQNKKKLNSHRWALNAFAAQLQPNVVILLDVGTKPTGTSLYELWKAFDKSPRIGGACGEIAVDVGRGCWNLINPLVASQNFEYKISNVLDKSTESIFGYISVLPGAFSAYRYKALLGRPLEAYFKGEAMHGAGATNAGMFEANMYLAEDRILCFEIVAKRREAWTLKYVKSAKATTDCPSAPAEFISQRRRWLNGSLFASIHAAVFWYRIWSSGHGFFRKLWLQVQWFYNVFQLIFSWTAMANFFLAFFFLMKSSTSDPAHDPFGGQGSAVLEVLSNVYIALVVVVLVCSLGNRPQGSRFAYTSVMIAFALIMGVALYCAGWTVWLAFRSAGLLDASGWTTKNFGLLLKTSGFRDIVIALAATYVLYLVASILHFEPWHMVTSFAQYLLLAPSYITVLGIYSMSNLSDLSWGTKGMDSAKDLGGANAQTKKDGKTVVEVKLGPQEKEDREELWQSMRTELATPKVEAKSHRDAAAKLDDHYRNIRTNWLLIWIGTNATLVIFFTSSWWTNYVKRSRTGNGPVVNPYSQAIFWSTAALAAVRFFGSTMYLLLRLLGH